MKVGQNSYMFLVQGDVHAPEALQKLGYLVDDKKVYAPREQVANFFRQFPNAQLKLVKENKTFTSIDDLLEWERESKVEVTYTSALSPLLAWGVPREEQSLGDPKFGL